MKPYSFLLEDFPPVDPNQQMLDPSMMGGDMGMGDPNAQQEEEFEPLIKSKADIPLSNEQAKKMETVAKIRQIEAKTKEIQAKAQQLENQSGMDMGMGDPSMMGGGIDPMTGMPMDPSMGGAGGGIDPMTGMPMDPSMGGGAAEPTQDPLFGLGDKSNSSGGGIDPMTGQAAPPSTVYTAIGRAYKLKELFDILIKIRVFLRDTANNEISHLYKHVNKAFEMFKLMINNLKIYKDQVDDMIILYYQFIKDILEQIQENILENEPED